MCLRGLREQLAAGSIPCEPMSITRPEGANRPTRAQRRRFVSRTQALNTVIDHSSAISAFISAAFKLHVIVCQELTNTGVHHVCPRSTHNMTEKRSMPKGQGRRQCAVAWNFIERFQAHVKILAIFSQEVVDICDSTA